MIGEFQKTGAPDYTEPIIGFRTWKLCGHELYPAYLGKKVGWTPGVNVAECGKNATLACEYAPQPECSCGLYAWFSFDDYEPPLKTSRKRRKYSTTQKELVRQRYKQCTTLEAKQQLARDAGIGDVQRLFNLANRLSQVYPESPPLIRGAVVMWGRIEIHETGMRAEFARIVALTAVDTGHQSRGLIAAVRYYRAPLVDDEALVDAARPYGQIWIP